MVYRFAPLLLPHRHERSLVGLLGQALQDSPVAFSRPRVKGMEEAGFTVSLQSPHKVSLLLEGGSIQVTFHSLKGKLYHPQGHARFFRWLFQKLAEKPP